MIKTKLPVIVLRNLILLPHGEIKLEISNEIDKDIIKNSINNHDSYVILVSTVSYMNENIDISELPNTGIIGKINSNFELPNNHLRITILGVNRANIFNYIEREKNELDALIGPVSYPNEEINEIEANLRMLKRDFSGYVSLNENISNSIILKLNEEDSLDKLTDIIANILPLNFDKKNKLIYEKSSVKRAKDLIVYIEQEKNICYIERKLDESVKKELDKSQKEYILKEKLKVIKEELGETDSKEKEIDEIKEKISSMNLPSNFEEKLNRELNRYECVSNISPESSTIKNYIDTVDDKKYSNIEIKFTQNFILSIQELAENLQKYRDDLSKQNEQIELELN